MNALLRFYQSSVGKKIIMSLTGLFLCTFLLEHLIGNLLVFKGEETYNAYTEFMVANPLIRTIEIGLFAALLFHPLIGFLLWLHNRKARSTSYEDYKLAENTQLASRITMLSGTIILLFLIVHLRTFFVPLRFGDVHPSPYGLIQEAFSSLSYSLFYLVALVLLGYHLKHGFQSAFQSLGLRHTKYNKLIDTAAAIFWLIIPLGFATIPIYFYWMSRYGQWAYAMGVH
ncbi:MAG TPA: succinate dehydrogenase cytochrome b subunit [Bacteroidota bacterium]|nr:succinate dehydrogenase cytochrome b subunit [Bacteroidota bacterium]